MRCLCAVAVGFVVLGAAATGQIAEPILGTWELIVAKSRLAGPPPRTETRTYTAVGGEIQATTRGLDNAGRPYSDQWFINYDGKEHPIDGNPNADAVIRRKVDPFTVELTLKRGGKVVATGMRVISKDGKTMTITEKGTDAKGGPIDTFEYFEKR